MSYSDLLAEEAKHKNALQEPEGSPAVADSRAVMSMRKSWSTDSLSSQSAVVKTCVCSPTTHAGSFRCRLHRMSGNAHVAHAFAPLPPSAPSSRPNE